MSFLDALRSRPAAKPVAAPPKVSAGPSDSDAVLPVLEFVGTLLKQWSRMPVLLGKEEREDVEQLITGWMRHATLGVPIPNHHDADAKVSGVARRDWALLSRLTTERRRAEMNASAEQVATLHGVIWETVGSLSAVAEAEQMSDAKVVNELGRVRSLALAGDASSLMKELPGALQAVTDTIRERQARAALERRALAARVDTLGRALSAAERAARTDALTGAGNRLRFEEDADRALQMMTLSGDPVALLVLDCDGFKGINDKHGHQAGDAALQAVAKSCYMVCSRPSDSICRIGGDEFAIILPQTERLAAATLADRLEQRLRETPVALTGSVRMPVPASVGFASAVPGEGREAWIARADANQYESKRARKS
jgi:diguanylate cyclase (GGDEF)-like protein